MNLLQVEEWFESAGLKLDDRKVWSIYKSLLSASVLHRVATKFGQHRSDPNVPGGLVRLPPLPDDQVPPFNWEHELTQVAKHLAA